MTVLSQLPSAKERTRRTVAMRPATHKRRLAYLVTQYPKVSHGFIRREILALEKQGWEIFRLSIRGWDAELPDPADVSERARTTFVLRQGLFSLMMAGIKQAMYSPRRFVSAAMMAIRSTRRWSGRPPVWQFFYLAEACWIATELKKHGITHIHAHFTSNDAQVAMLASELAGITYSVTAHGADEFEKARWPDLAEKIKRAIFVVAVSSFARAQLFRLIDYRDWHKIKVIHCGIDKEFAKVDAIAPAANDRLVCVGRICEEKGQLLLVKAVAALVREGRRLELVLVGDGEHRGPVDQLIAENDLSEFVRVTGWASASQVKDEILRARALILPSFAEGLPLVLVEAMALGRPVLSTYIAAIPELVVNGKAGWLFPAGSEDDVLEAIRSCLDASEETLKEMGQFARARALQRHDVDVEAAKLSELFDSALQESNS
jgi:colanic acid/amylovoran biosynthesis glycosyltransferase